MTGILKWNWVLRCILLQSEKKYKGIGIGHDAKLTVEGAVQLRV